jgi:hypothetical protein
MRIRAAHLVPALALSLGLVATLPAGAEEKKGQPPAMSAEEQAMMEKWMAFAAPSDGHKALASKVGTWDATVKMWMSPDAPPSESKGTSKLEMIMDGRYLQDTTEGQAMGQSSTAVASPATTT